jgi:hypothetical protein
MQFDMNTLDRLEQQNYQRYINKVDKDGEVKREGLTPCWKWNGGKSSGGYGEIMFQYVAWNAHRYSWWVHNGCPDMTIFKGRHILHECDNPECSNPEHLKIGTPTQNAIEAVQRIRVIKPKAPRQRVLVACNHCREHRHLKCDDAETCTHCAAAGIECVRVESAPRPQAFKPGDNAGDSNPRAKLTWDIVREIRSRRDKGLKYGQLKLMAEEFGIAYITIQKIVADKLWKE